MSSVRAFLAVILVAALAACDGSAPPPEQTQAAAPSAAAAAPASTPTSQSASGPMGGNLPPLPVTPFPAARPPEIVRAVYTFAAEHPEVLSKVPCFCGCENRGHKNNDDCFVAGRDARGRVTAWEPHGVG